MSKDKTAHDTLWDLIKDIRFGMLAHRTSGGMLHAQRKLRLQQVKQLSVQLISALGAEITHFHAQAPTMRVTNTVSIGSLAAASRKASRASASSTPSISYSTLPG